MKQRRKTFWTYTVLFLSLIAASFILGFEVKHYLYEQTDPLEDIRQSEPDAQQVLQKYNEGKQQEREEILFAFNQTSAFSSLGTPVPYPTSTPMPLPSPTPVIPANGYKVRFAANSMVILQKYDNSEIMKKPGEIVEDPQVGNFKILEGASDFRNTSAPFKVKVQDVATGVVRWIEEQAPAK
ncbi:MAG: hypothetical protein GC154_10150 [bacterium]|nr:hypothetical protein [bacterium]